MDILRIIALVCFAADALFHKSLTSAGLALMVLAGW